MPAVLLMHTQILIMANCYFLVHIGLPDFSQSLHIDCVCHIGILTLCVEAVAYRVVLLQHGGVVLVGFKPDL